jgi:hypothetical protein
MSEDTRSIEFFDQLTEVAMSTPFDQRKAFWDAQDETAKHELAQRGFDLSAGEPTEGETIPKPPAYKEPKTEPAPTPKVHREIPSTVDRLKDLGAGELSADMSELVNREGLREDASLTDVVGLADKLGIKLDGRALARAAAHAPPAGAAFTGRIDIAPEDIAPVEKAAAEYLKGQERQTPAGEQVTYTADGRMVPAKSKKK